MGMVDRARMTKVASIDTPEVVEGNGEEAVEAGSGAEGVTSFLNEETAEKLDEAYHAIGGGGSYLRILFWFHL